MNVKPETPTLYLDTEFNGFGGSFISMAIVASDGREFYEVADIPADPHPWVAENVIPVLGKEPIGLVKFKSRLRQFLAGFGFPTIVVDWPSDPIWFFEMMMGKDHSESSLYACRVVLLPVDYDSATPHNALEDARAIRRAVEGA